MTGMGVILGTAAYMSPEQARGRSVDKRTDVWAFGAVLYEMLTGTRAFEGEDVTETMASVVKSTPNWTAIPADVPPHVVTLIQRCLEKDRSARIGDIAVARFLLSDHATLERRTCRRGEHGKRACAAFASAAVVGVAHGCGRHVGGAVLAEHVGQSAGLRSRTPGDAGGPSADERRAGRAVSRVDKRALQTGTYRDGIVARWAKVAFAG